VLRLKVVHLQGALEQTLGLLLRLLSLLGRQLQEVLDHLLQGVHVHLLAHDAVLDETFL
jgi:hypothetical protein